ncbi:MAG: transcription elongation factor Spt5 [Candidatus Poseidoniia archaeon]|jgi:transcriptional antiterminator NusG|nr:transcription elongation factor Spt5 [Candidatus Poseidoniia archaeon]MDP7606926.1 transcription elongation factor Spt5 [Candidatus Poseidoniia archaeon]
MATFEDETEPETPSPEASIYIMKTAIGREQTAGERLADRVRRSGAPVWSILAPSKLRGFVFVETDSPELLRDNLKGLTHARGMVMVKGIGYGRSKQPDSFGTSTLEELKPHLTPPPAVTGIAEGNIVEVIAGPFKGEKARVQRIDEGKEEVTVELFEAMVPIPITVRGDHVRVLEKEPN